MSGSVTVEPVPTVLSSLTVTDILLVEGPIMLNGGFVTVTPTTNPLVINGNTGTISSYPTGSELVLVGADSKFTTLPLYSYGAAVFSSVRGLHANGTQGTPLAVPLNQVLFQISGDGYDSSTFFANAGLLKLTANENFTPTNHGTRWDFQTTNVGTSSRSTKMSIGDQVLIGTTVPTGTNSLQVAGGASIDTFLSAGLQGSTSYANDAAAAAGGVIVGQFYRNGSAVQCRIV